MADSEHKIKTIVLRPILDDDGADQIVENGKISSTYNEEDTADYMKSKEIKINVQIGNGNKEFEVFTMDLTKKYIDINADYRS